MAQVMCWLVKFAPELENPKDSSIRERSETEQKMCKNQLKRHTVKRVKAQQKSKHTHTVRTSQSDEMVKNMNVRAKCARSHSTQHIRSPRHESHMQFLWDVPKMIRLHIEYHSATFIAAFCHKVTINKIMLSAEKCTALSGRREKGAGAKGKKNRFLSCKFHVWTQS